MKKYSVIAIALFMVLVLSVAAMAANGTWKSYASMGSGSMVSGTQYAQYSTKVGGVLQPLATVAANWTLTSNSTDPAGKSVDYSSTTMDAGNTVWNINDNNSVQYSGGNTYDKMYITPGSFDSSRGLVMVKMKVNSGANSTNTTFGISTSNGGVQVALRGGSNGAVRIRGGEGATSAPDPASFDQTVYRVYAIGWVGTKVNVWYSNGSDWTSDVAGWTKIGNNFDMSTEQSLMTGGAPITGIVFNDGGSSNVFNANIQWIAHNTYDNVAGEMNPWDFDPTLASVPEPGSLLALASGLFGLVGYVARRKRA